jgi:hypothetical protein
MIYAKFDWNWLEGFGDFFHINICKYCFPYCGPSRPPGTMMWKILNLHYIRNTVYNPTYGGTECDHRGYGIWSVFYKMGWHYSLRYSDKTRRILVYDGRQWYLSLLVLLSHLAVGTRNKWTLQQCLANTRCDAILFAIWCNFHLFCHSMLFNVCT